LSDITGDRVRLRAYRESDIPALREWVNDPQVTRFLEGLSLFPHTRHDTESFVRAQLAPRPLHPESLELVVADRHTDVYLGQVGLLTIDWPNRATALGIVFPRKNQGKGYGGEALDLLGRLVFDDLGLHRLELEVHEDNLPALRCYQRCGFREEGRRRERRFSGGRFRDVVIMALLESDHRLRQNGTTSS